VSNPEVGTSSTFFIFLAVAFGFLSFKMKLPLLWTSLIFVPLLFGGIYLGHLFPLTPEIFPAFFAENPVIMWSVLLVIYAFFASILPVWSLLQPRDYLSSF